MTCCDAGFFQNQMESAIVFMTCVLLTSLHCCQMILSEPKCNTPFKKCLARTLLWLLLVVIQRPVNTNLHPQRNSYGVILFVYWHYQSLLVVWKYEMWLKTVICFAHWKVLFEESSIEWICVRNISMWFLTNLYSCDHTCLSFPWLVHILVHICIRPLNCPLLSHMGRTPQDRWDSTCQ